MRNFAATENAKKGGKKKGKGESDETAVDSEDGATTNPGDHTTDPAGAESTATEEEDGLGPDKTIKYPVEGETTTEEVAPSSTEWKRRSGENLAADRETVESEAKQDEGVMVKSVRVHKF